MRTARRSSSAYDGLFSALRAMLARRAQELTGLCFVALAGAVAVALATWSVDDPSLNNATDMPVRNMLAWPGAIVADLLMQLLGLGAIAALLPLALWGWRLMKSGELGRGQLRFALWIMGVGAATALASAMPATDRWPLPTGLGGVVGDALLTGAKAITGLSTGPAHAILGIVFATIAILSLTAACSLSPVDARHEEEPDEMEAPLPVKRRRIADQDEADETGHDEPGWGIVSLGALAHGFMSLRASARRWRENRHAPMEDEEYEEVAPPLRQGRNGTQMRRESTLDSPLRAARTTPIAVPAYEEDEDAPWDDEPMAEAVPRAVRPEPAPTRVAPAHTAPRPGKRMAREAQPSLLDEANYPGPVVTLYELEPAPGTKSSRVISLADDIARSMSAVSARVAVVQGRNAIGIELPNHKRETVYLRELLASQDFETSKQKLALCLGKTIGGEPVIADLARMPHLLVAGTTGSGKSVAINTMILSLVYRMTPAECRLIMVDPKMLELSVYDGIPHLLTPVVTDPKKAVVALKWAVREMEDRYRKMSKLGVRNIDGFNARVSEAKARAETITRTVQTGFDRETGEAVYEDEVMDLEPLPYIVVIVDEMADLMMVAGKEIEGAIQRLAQMARAAGIHVILATQRPSVDVITGTIKANFPTRISFQVTSKIDSRTILGEMGAEQLLGQGDMLYMAGGGRITRVHGPFCSDEEVEHVVAHLKRQGRPQYLEAVTADEEEAAAPDTAVFDQGEFGAPGGDLYDQAVAVVLRDKKASTSYIQRRLQIGYNRAASLMERMENEGIVGPANHAGKREIL
ncbi:DNA translocase FtsK 4TM domain-containing protein, partial [Microvirga sp. 2YAF29]|uniref:FtsK/SpoIIIE family DNA translocase n=1 Tax=Microvirga sp. 2YAF29 TaxID=3233031 RepID=UPI003F965B08